MRASLLAAAAGAALLHDASVASAQPSAVGSVELAAGTWDTVLGIGVEGDRPVPVARGVSSAIGLIPAIEWPLGRTVWLGGELLLLWVDDPFWLFDERRLVTGLNARGRLVFPIGAGFGAELFAAAGLATWAADPGLGTPYGWTRRFGAGASHAFADGYAGFLALSFCGLTAWRFESVFEGGRPRAPELVEMRTVLLSLGVRSGD